jgi:hypothetical protein
MSIFGNEYPKFIYNLGVADLEFTVDASTNIFTTATAHGLFNNEIITLLTSTTLPSPLAVLTNYYVIVLSPTTFQLALTRNGAAIDITDTGTGTQTLKTEFTVMLGQFVPTEDGPEGSRAVVIESELETDRTFITRGGQFWKYSGKELLFKYLDETLIRSKFEEIYQFNEKKVYLYKYKDGYPYNGFDGNPVKFFLECYPANIENLDFHDLLYLTFSSEKGIDFSNNSTLVIQPSEVIIEGGAIV